jgi:hypothetical protein
VRTSAIDLSFLFFSVIPFIQSASITFLSHYPSDLYGKHSRASSAKTPNAWLSRAVAAINRETLIVNLRGQQKSGS